MSTLNSYKPICMSKQINSTIIDLHPQILDAPYTTMRVIKRSLLSLNKAAKTCKHL